ncbi:chemotaxis protein CheW [Alsobacter sp. R-9]
MTAHAIRDALEPVASATTDYVTVVVGGQLFGLPIGCVHDVFFTGAVTAIPLAPPQVSGLINLRGRVVTALCLRCLLGMPKGPTLAGTMVVCLEHDGESYGLIVDRVGEVMNLPASESQPIPMNLDPRWARCASGIHWLEEGLLVVVDVDRLLDPAQFPAQECRPDETQKGQVP